MVDAQSALFAHQSHQLRRNVVLESIVRDKVLEANLEIVRRVMSVYKNLQHLRQIYLIHLKEDHVRRVIIVRLVLLQWLVRGVNICRTLVQLLNRSVFLAIQESIVTRLEGLRLMETVRRDIFAQVVLIQLHQLQDYVLRDINAPQEVHHQRHVLYLNIRISKASKLVSHAWKGFNALLLQHQHVQLDIIALQTM